MIKIGIAGGIGSGKSTLCRLFADQKGIAHYDSDSRAQSLMRGDLREEIIARFGGESFVGCELNRAFIAKTVFNDQQALAELNAIVHPAVIKDFEMWTQQQMGDYVIIESAILFESGLDKCVDFTVVVLSPKELRLERVCERDGADKDDVLKRMAAQMDDDQMHSRADYCVVNIFDEDLASSVVKLDIVFRGKAATNG